MGKILKRRPSPALVIAVIALIAALVGTAYAAKKINGKSIKNASIPGKKLKSNTVTGAKVNESTLEGVTAGNVLGIKTTNACAVASAIGGTYTLNLGLGLSCSITFPRDISNCAVTADVINSAISTPRETSIRRLGGDQLELVAYDGVGANGTGSAEFDVVALCP
ncbi:MAG: hypothetical protein EXQ70_12000 [Solirubrobacterales bacterium]|nr:hypothetical protein [Solirubrobacterales bacterium]